MLPNIKLLGGMKMNTIIKTNKQKELVVKKIGMDYKKIKFYESNSSMICENNSENLKEKLEYYYNLKDNVYYILLQLDDSLSKVIYNEYLTRKKDDWWIYYYSRSTYYRLRKKAINIFLEWWYA